MFSLAKRPRIGMSRVWSAVIPYLTSTLSFSSRLEPEESRYIDFPARPWSPNDQGSQSDSPVGGALDFGITDNAIHSQAPHTQWEDGPTTFVCFYCADGIGPGRSLFFMLDRCFCSSTCRSAFLDAHERPKWIASRYRQIVRRPTARPSLPAPLPPTVPKMRKRACRPDENTVQAGSFFFPSGF